MHMNVRVFTLNEKENFYEQFFLISADHRKNWEGCLKKADSSLQEWYAATDSDGLRSVCADPKYSFYGYNFLNTKAVMPVSCNIVPLPDTCRKGIMGIYNLQK